MCVVCPPQAWICGRPLLGDKTYDGNDENAKELRGRGLFLCSNKVVLEHPFYNTRAGREVWDSVSESDKVFEGGKLFLEGGIVKVTASIELPAKFESTLRSAEAGYKRFGGVIPENEEDLEQQ